MVSALLGVAVAPSAVYATILVLLTVDAFVPVVPAQALMIGGGILAASGDLHLVFVVAAGALGAFAGDLLCFRLGRRLAAREAREALGTAPATASRGVSRRGGRLAQSLRRRVAESMRRHAFLAVLVCRFIPTGRMMTAAYAGRSGYGHSRFAAYDLLAVTIWATYGALLGQFGGRALIDSSWLSLVGVVVAAALFMGAAPLSSAVAHLRQRRA